MAVRQYTQYLTKNIKRYDLNILFRHLSKLFTISLYLFIVSRNLLHRSFLADRLIKNEI